MRVRYIIAFGSVVAAIAVAAVALVLLRPLSEPSAGAILARLRPAAPLLATVWAAAYGLGAAMLTAAGLLSGLRRLRGEIEGRAVAIGEDPARLSELLNRHPAKRIAGLLARLGRGPSGAFDPTELIARGRSPALRRAGLRLFGLDLLRAQAATALLLLAVLAITQGVSALPPAAWALLAVVLVGLIGVGFVVRASAMLAAALAAIPQAHPELPLLRQILAELGALAERQQNAAGVDGRRLRAAVEAAQRPTREAITGLAAAVEGLGRNLRAGLDAQLDAFKAQPGAAPGADAADGEPALAASFQAIEAELRDTLAALNRTVEAIERLTARPSPVAGSGAADLPQQLRSLLSEFDANGPA